MVTHIHNNEGAYMAKIRHCEFCGTIGASKEYVEGNSYAGDFYLCEYCSNMWKRYDLPGKTREQLLNTIHSIHKLHLHGPKSLTFSRDRVDFIWSITNFCENCSRKANIEGFHIGDDIKMTPRIKKALPLKLKRDHVLLCSKCMDELKIRMVAQMTLNELPLKIHFDEFQFCDGEKFDVLNEEVINLIKKRLRGEPLDNIHSLDSPKLLKCLDISLDYLTEKDRRLFYKDGELQKGIDEDGNPVYQPTDANPLIIAAYEHGYLIELDMDMLSGLAIFQQHMRRFGYSKLFRKIICKAIELNFDYIRFDTIGPKYKEFSEKMLKLS